MSPAWIWGIAGLLLLAAELTAPGFYLLWIGLAALVVAGAAAVIDIGLHAQILIFAGSAVVTCGSGWLVYRRGKGAPDIEVNQTGTQLIGSTGEVLERAASGLMRVRVRDTVWLATGPEIAVGAPIRVIGQDGPRLRIEPIA